jgi:hypothetical protein
MNPAEYGKADGRIFKLDQVVLADFSKLPELEVLICLSTGQQFKAYDIDAVELAYALKPSVIEGRRLRHARHMWIVHNIIGHPLMSVLAACKCYRAAFWVHDMTVPKVKR